MPELPDVEIFKQYLNATSLHHKIEAVEARSQDVLADCFLQPKIDPPYKKNKA